MYKIAFLKHNKVVAVIRCLSKPKTIYQLYNFLSEAVPINRFGNFASVEAHKTYNYCRFIISLLELDNINPSSLPEAYYQYIQIVPIDSHIWEVSDVNPNELYCESDGQHNCLLCYELHNFCTHQATMYFSLDENDNTILYGA